MKKFRKNFLKNLVKSSENAPKAQEKSPKPPRIPSPKLTYFKNPKWRRLVL
jgi:hypothetical protein